jgi:hypothetical protein
VGDKLTFQVKRDIDVKLVVSKGRMVDKRRSTIKLVVCVPVYYDEDEEITIATFGTDGNFSVSSRAVKRAGLELAVDEVGV